MLFRSPYGLQTPCKQLVEKHRRCETDGPLYAESLPVPHGVLKLK